VNTLLIVILVVAVVLVLAAVAVALMRRGNPARKQAEIERKQDQARDHLLDSQQHAAEAERERAAAAEQAATARRERADADLRIAEAERNSRERLAAADQHTEQAQTLQQRAYELDPRLNDGQEPALNSADDVDARESTPEAEVENERPVHAE
jgi:uncharacterized protein (DUF3084 family)